MVLFYKSHKLLCESHNLELLHEANILYKIIPSTLHG